MTFSGTYSPDDNKLRLYASSRLDKDLYEKVIAAGYRWAPKQECFIAPMWTPQRYDLLLSLCGEVDDEDKSLLERAEERSERFEGYQESRLKDAANASNAASALAGQIPFGQPILVGHHSEGRARRDAARITAGMRKSVDNWNTAQYWERRAAAAVRHAKYKSLPAVRHRRIKGLEADQRKAQRNIDDAAAGKKVWSMDGLTPEQVLFLAGRAHLNGKFPLEHFPRNPPASQYEGDMSLYSALTGQVITHEKAIELALLAYARQAARALRWNEHYTFRIAYERAMLGEQGGLVAEGFDIQVGGQVFIRQGWETVTRLNKRGGVLNSISTGKGRIRQLPEVKDYQAPSAEAAAQAKENKKLPPLLNYPGENFEKMTTAEWKAKYDGYKSVRIIPATSTRPEHRARNVLTNVRGATTLVQVFITDAKQTDKAI
ncbi:DUF3560 domain-containing protein [Janthinobacterium sp. MDT1-19]|uniref:DUF3560 domain-containing protein n=1 Tax=Janthinobacterium sp. MDT1-19 TaxID=1259339 RepID=UPI003F24CFFA